jgi:hypothetical protein
MMLVIVPELIGIHRFSYVAGIAAFLFVTLSLGTSKMAAASATVADPALDDNDNDNSERPTLAFGISRRAHQARQGHRKEMYICT